MFCAAFAGQAVASRTIRIANFRIGHRPDEPRRKYIPLFIRCVRPIHLQLDLWGAFHDDPDWKKLNTVADYNFEPIVSNITNLVLTPAAYSQI
jgi:hypothetical protein